MLLDNYKALRISTLPLVYKLLNTFKTVLAVRKDEELVERQVDILIGAVNY